MLTLNRMLALGPSRDQANAVREQRGLAPSADASFFSYRTVTLEPKARPWAPDGEDVVSWSGLPIEAHVYERLGGQSLPGAAAAFLCSARPPNATRWRRRSSTTRATSWSRVASSAGSRGSPARGSGAGLSQSSRGSGETRARRVM